MSDEWSAALLGGQIVIASITALELLYSARSGQEFAEIEEEISQLRVVAVTETVIRGAIAGLRELSTRTDGYHRVAPPDAIVAAAAQDSALGVLHYDHDFDRLAEVIAFESRWIAPAGSIA